MPSLNYSHLRYFWAVAHEANLTRAAERLGVSQSVLSVQIRKLEARLGHALFERRNRQLQLTEAGRIALDHADAIFASGDELIDALGHRSATRQIVRIGARATLSRNFQIGFLRPVLALPDVEVILRSGSSAELLGELAALNLDIVLTNDPPPVDTSVAYLAHPLDAQPVSLVAVPGMLAGSHDLAALLSEHPVILPAAGSVRSGFDALASRLGVRLRVAAEVDDMAMMRLLVREGTALAVVPPIVVADELASGLLVEADHLPGISETFYAVTVKRRFTKEIVQWLLKPAALTIEPISVASRL